MSKTLDWLGNNIEIVTIAGLVLIVATLAVLLLIPSEIEHDED